MRFDPFAWAAKFVPPSTIHLAIRLGAVAILTWFLARRIGEYDAFLLKPLWVVETLIFAVLVGAYWLRRDPVDRSVGVREVLIPLAGAWLPFALLTSAPHPAIWRNPTYLYSVFWVMAAGTALTVWGMWSLRRAFSITVEARELQTGGPYRLVRHPIYAGELLTACAVTVWRFSWLNLAIFIAFAAIQLYRSRLEEAKLARIFPQYREFRSRSRWFW